MKKAVVVPTYWGRPSSQGWRKGDIIYDHPTPLDKEGTFLRLIESISLLDDKDFTLFLLVATTNPELDEAAERRVRELLAGARAEVEVVVFAPSQLRKLKALIEEEELSSLLSLQGYSNIRNLCILIPHLFEADAIIFVDDDEVFEDRDFMKRALEFLGENYRGERILAKAGYYIQPEGGVLLRKDFKPYMRYWDSVEKMNQAFQQYILCEERIQRCPFVFGGNMVLHREVFTRIPFDPAITRGEDIDYLINASIFGFSFFIDNKLKIRHLPPPKPYPEWMKIRVDIIRFLYEREKLRRQRPAEGTRRIFAEELDPYPGAFLKDDLEEKITGAMMLLALEYLTEGKEEDARQALENIKIAKEFKTEDPFQRLLELQKKWVRLTELFYRNRDKLRQALLT